MTCPGWVPASDFNTLTKEVKLLKQVRGGEPVVTTDACPEILKLAEMITCQPAMEKHFSTFKNVDSPLFTFSLCIL